jgi:CheY-like chemotaxis protein
MVRLSASAPETVGKPAATLEGVHVVVVDDDHDARMLFCDVLELAGARVTTASSARAALAAIEREVPDVLVSDIMMPIEDGYWLIQAVRELPLRGHRRPRALALTGDFTRHPRDRALRAGYDAHLGKPVSVDVLCAAVARLAARG